MCFRWCSSNDIEISQWGNGCTHAASRHAIGNQPESYQQPAKTLIVVDDQRYIYSADDIRFMVDEAGRAGLKLAAHAWTHQGAHNAAMAGVASIEHGFAMTDEDLEIAKKNNVVLVGTFSG